MAIFIPDIDPETIPHDSERITYEALWALPDAYVVLHSLPWLRPDRDYKAEPLREGEADFVILHPERGMLVLEVKGGVPELRNRTWFRGSREMRDPFDQARRNRYALLGAVEDRTRGRIHRGLFTHGDVVIFPHCLYSDGLPHNADPRILIDADGLRDMTARIESAFGAWPRHPAPMDRKTFTDLLDGLMPKLRLLRCVGSEIAGEANRIVQVTEEQRATMLGLLESDRVLVQGTAGSGKTLLAMEFAATLAAEGKSVLLLCFNRNLADWLKEQATTMGPRFPAGSVEISSFHSFALTAAGKARVEFVVPPGNTQSFWDEEVPLILEQALEILRAERSDALSYDAVIVDEAQDFAKDWWVTVESLTRSGRNGRLYVFLDMNQNVRGGSGLPPVMLPTKFRLTTNCRNTCKIAKSAAHLIDADVTLLPGMPLGELPGLRQLRNAAAQAGIVLDEVRKAVRSGLKPRQIALIGPASHPAGSLSGTKNIDGVPLVTNAAEWRRGDGFLVTTAKAFKGLEADQVILYDVGGIGGAFTLPDIYVAWTRARHRLIIVCHGQEVQRLIGKALQSV